MDDPRADARIEDVGQYEVFAGLLETPIDVTRPNTRADVLN